MCGITGFVGEGDIQTLSGMTEVLTHRGPDGFGYFHYPQANAFLGHRRLSIIDIEGGRQPMANEDGMVQVVFNGEIYNHRELREELVAKGHVFRTDHSDTEVLVHGYEEWESDLPLRLNGMFAFAVLDIAKQKLMLARDRFGEKPLYYCVQQNFFAFASELKALLIHPRIKREVSKTAMMKLFALGFIPAPSSIIEAITKVPPAHLVVLDLQTWRVNVKSYWTFHVGSVSSPVLQSDELAEQLRYLISQAVKRRLMSDVPLGVFLSGGLDSTIVLSAVAEHARDIYTFSIGFNEPSFDESSYARLVAEYFGTRHYTEIIDMNKARVLLDQVLDNLDEPIGDPSILPTFLLAQFAQRRVKVALGGDGGDELFAGYDPFRALAPAKLYAQLVPKWMHSSGRAVLQHLRPSERNMSWEFRLQRTLRGLSYPIELWNAVWLGPMAPLGLSHLFGESIRIEEVYEDVLHLWAQSGNSELGDKTLEFYSRLYLPNDILTKVDRASMMVSLEARAPLLDNDLVDFARKLPFRYKLSGQTTKYLIKSAYKNKIPNEVIRRPKKGFGIPLGKWLREWDDFSFLDSLPFVDRDWLKSCWDDHRKGLVDHRQLLWCAISIHSFLKAGNLKIH